MSSKDMLYKVVGDDILAYIGRRRNTFGHAPSDIETEEDTTM